MPLDKLLNFFKEKNFKSNEEKIREDLASKYTFTGDLINYRKNGETYICNINIVPIYSKKDELKYFLAIEKEVQKAHKNYSKLYFINICNNKYVFRIY